MSLNPIKKTAYEIKQNFSTMSYTQQDQEQIEQHQPTEQWLESFADDEIPLTVLDTSCHYNVSYADSSLELIFSIPSNQLNKEDSFQPSLQAEEELRNLITPNQEELVLAQSFASGIPVWQIKEHDLHRWKRFSLSALPSLPPTIGRSINNILIPLSLDGIPTVDRIIQLLRTLVRSEIYQPLNFCLIGRNGNSQDAQAFIPAFCLLRAFLRARIIKTRLNVFLLNSESPKLINLLKDQANLDKFMVWYPGAFIWELPGDVQLLPSLVSGAISGIETEGRIRRKFVYILDSTGDVSTTTETIITDLWMSGTMTSRRDGSILLVEESYQEELLLKFENEIGKLKENVDFIGGTWKVKEDLETKARAEGIRIIPDTSKLDKPTIVTDIGTSSPLLNLFLEYGHLLVVIPYRNKSELLSFLPIFGTSRVDLTFFSCRTSFLQDLSNVLNKTNVRARFVPITQYAPSFENQFQEDEFGCWTAFKIANTDVSINPNVLSDTKISEYKASLQLLKKGVSGWDTLRISFWEEKVKEAYISLLLKEYGKRMLNDEWMELDPNPLQMRDGCESLQMSSLHNPLGIIGIIVNSDLDTAKAYTIMKAILSANEKGSAVMLIYLDSISNTLEYASHTIDLIHMSLVEFVEVTSVLEGIHLLCSTPEIDVVWLLLSGEKDDQLISQFPSKRFSRIIVSILQNHRSDVKSINKSLSNCHLLEYSFTVNY